MRILYLLGNGFDLQLGLKTKYEHFYEYYCSLPSKDNRIISLKSQINQHIIGGPKALHNIDWSDLEMALGKYTEELESYEDLRTVYLDVNNALITYLKSQEELLKVEEQFFSKLKTDLTLPEQYLSENGRLNYRMQILAEPILIDILTFNYTRCVESIFGKGETGASSKNYKTTIRDVLHIHGDLSMSNVLVGVNDSSQIVNESLREDINIQEMLIKPVTNDMLDVQRNQKYVDKIKSARIIVIYGASLGDSDKKWRDLLRQRLEAKNVYFLIFEHNEKIETIYDRARIERSARKAFLSKLGIDESNNQYDNNIFVAVTKDMFHIDKPTLKL